MKMTRIAIAASAMLLGAPALFAGVGEGEAQADDAAPEKGALFEVSTSGKSYIAASAEGSASAAQTRGETLYEYDPTELLNFRFDARVDYQRNWLDSHNVKSNSGFEGKYINFQLDGSIIPDLTYSWRQRLNKSSKDSNFFDATDWVYIAYKYRGWHFSAGKEVVAIGGWEYDRAPINLFGCSVFWNNVPCYDLGVTVGYDLTPDDNLKFQVTQSPFYTPSNRDMYAYNLMWSGSHGFFKALYSANLIEYADGRYINYLVLGNRFEAGPAALELDLMNRASSHQPFFFKDCSVMAELSYRPTPSWNIFAKCTYDVNKSGTDADACVLNGTELTMIGGGLEFFPLKKKKASLRLHANCFYSWGHNANSTNVMQNKTTLLDFGITWYMNVLKVRR